MEEGSLLREALEFMERKGGRKGNIEELQNTLEIHVYDILEQSSSENRITLLQRLAQVAHDLNSFFQESNYPWIMGGDGPIFGIDVSECGVPHLKACCRYGFHVMDEWKAVQLMLFFSENHPNVAIQCWDLDDGPILLIECANELPHWLDDAELDARHVCWIVQGKVSLVGRNNSLSLREALETLRGKDTDQISVLDGMQRHLKEHLNAIASKEHSEPHKTAIVVPRPVARLFQRRPDLLPCIATLFEKNSHHEEPSVSNSEGRHEDWVFSTVSLPRTHYAVLRTLTTPIWRSERTIPPAYRSVELKRLQRTCQREATPHLHHAWQVGMRLVAGVDYALSSTSSRDNDKKALSFQSIPQDRLLLGWNRIDSLCGGDGQWVTEAWHRGPNVSQHDVTHLLSCPVCDPELSPLFPCPLSRPGKMLEEEIRQELHRKDTKDESFVMPRQDEVDGDDWLQMGDALLEEAAVVQQAPSPPTRTAKEATKETFNKQEQQMANTVLGSFQDFVQNESGVDGVENKQTDEPVQINPRQTDEPVQINPRVFLNMLHYALKSSPRELSTMHSNPTTDDFFSEQDYAMLDPDDNDDSDERGVAEMDALMQAMDDELRQSSGTSRVFETTETGQDIPDESVAEEAHVLSNLLKSLDESGGAPGPVRNIMREMGVEPPVFLSDSDEED